MSDHEGKIYYESETHHVTSTLFKSGEDSYPLAGITSIKGRTHYATKRSIQFFVIGLAIGLLLFNINWGISVGIIMGCIGFIVFSKHYVVVGTAGTEKDGASFSLSDKKERDKLLKVLQEAIADRG